MPYNFERIYRIVHSMIEKAQLQRESYGFRTYTGTRVAVIQDRIKKNDWWWISGKSTTRATNHQNLQTDKMWKTGPEFLRRTEKEWPICQKCTVESTSLPDVIGLNHHSKQEFPVRKKLQAR